MTLPRELIREVRRLDPAQLRRLMILARGLLTGADAPIAELSSIAGLPEVTYRRQNVRCGRSCSACPHGPYWYAFWKEGGRTRSMYIGSDLPADIERRCRELDQSAPRATGTD